MQQNCRRILFVLTLPPTPLLVTAMQHGASSWLQSAANWVMTAAAPPRPVGEYRGGDFSGTPRRPRGLASTAGAFQYDDSPGSEPDFPAPNSCMNPVHRQVIGGDNRHHSPGGGEARQLQGGSPAARLHRGGGGGLRPATNDALTDIELACGGRWYSRLTPNLMVGRKPLSVCVSGFVCVSRYACWYRFRGAYASKTLVRSLSLSDASPSHAHTAQRRGS